MTGQRICFVGWGDHVHFERWVNRFAGLGHTLSVVSFTDLGRFSPEVTAHRIGLRDRGMRWQILMLRYLLWRIQPQVVHVHWAGFAPAVMSAWRGPTVITAWGSDIYRAGERPAPDRLALQRSLRQADVVTCDSDDLAREIAGLAGTLRRPVDVLQWGVDVDTFAPGPPIHPIGRQLAGLGGPVVFSARNFTPLYNQDTVVRAFALARRHVPEAVLVMKFHNGLIEERDRIQALANELGIAQAVVIIDSVPYEQMADFYRVAAVTVSIPSSDATPMALLEAMACGSAPVFSDLPSLREWIVDGQNGYLVASSDVDMLALRLVDLLQKPDLRADFARRNRAIVIERGSEAASAAAMQATYRELAR
ncbi:MAG: glycosyltransferase [Rubrivivax sp.]|nr:glycosyltransferase [Rubrivivax sp.]